MDKEIIDKVMFDNFLRSVPTMVVDAKDRKTISAYGNIDVNDLMSAVDRLNKVPDYNDLLKENQELKKQLEEKDILIKQCELSVSNVMDCYCERTDCSGRIKDSKVYDSLEQKIETQQKEFINYLLKEIENKRRKSTGLKAFERNVIPLKDVLQKYKEIIGDD